MAKRITLTIGLLFVFFINGSSVRAVEVDCRMDFRIKSWSFLYRSSKGTGNIYCSNGQRAPVSLRGDGGGFTFGKSKIVHGLGVFSDVSSINQLYGTYTNANAEAHVGLVDSASARALTKGDVSLTLTGTGKGVDVGVNFGGFKISKL
ncbi:MAG: hypothetical protein HQM16_03565 [Deltaproteobacteria bacterium]|nr:hypothetical protein [Deltaproteobacteria bacterium]